MGLAAYSNVLKGFNGLMRVTRSGRRHVSSSDTQNNITYNHSSKSIKALCSFFFLVHISPGHRFDIPTGVMGMGTQGVAGVPLACISGHLPCLESLRIEMCRCACS